MKNSFSVSILPWSIPLLVMGGFVMSVSMPVAEYICTSTKVDEISLLWLTRSLTMIGEIMSIIGSIGFFNWLFMARLKNESNLV